MSLVSGAIVGGTGSGASSGQITAGNVIKQLRRIGKDKVPTPSTVYPT